MYFNFFGYSIGLIILSLLSFGILQWLHIPAGNFIDWLIAIASFEWLLAIVTVPWNIYFDAKEVIAEATISAEKGIVIDEKQIKYAKIVARRSLITAIALHLFSTITLYTLAAIGISTVGYISSGAALLLTLLRPAWRGYQYLASRLATIRQQVNYPREDVLELRTQFNTLKHTVKEIEEQLNLEDPRSWVNIQQHQWEATQNELTRLAASLQEFKVMNQAEHDKLSRETQQAIAQLTTDGQFLDRVREIIRFFKTA